jgi:hypothetical protein
LNNKLLITVGVALFLAVCAYAGYMIFAPIPVDSTLDEIPTSMDPIQIMDYTTKLPSITKNDVTFDMNVKAKYKLYGIVETTKSYNTDTVSRIAPYDYGVAWGEVPEWSKYMNFSQYGRFCNYTYKLDSPVDPKYVVSHMSNNHMIPSNPNIKRSLPLARKGDKVQIEGYLVWVTGNNPARGTFHWNSSLRRDDYGNGACEIIYVTKLQINKKVYE